MRIIKSGINDKHKFGEFSPKIHINGYTFCYFLTPFVYEQQGKLIASQKGEFLVVGPNAIRYHGPTPDMQEGYINDWIHIYSEEIPKWLSKYPIPLNTAFPVSNPKLLRNVIRELIKENTEKKEHYREKMQLSVHSLILELHRHYTTSINKLPQNDVLTSVRTTIHSNLSQQWTLADMAALANYSTSRFSTLYKAKFGISPVDDLLEKRITSAKKLLKYTDMSISEIATDLQFHQVQHFSRYFKKLTGKSPSEYRSSCNEFQN